MHPRALFPLTLALPASIALADPHHGLTAERAGHVEQRAMAFRLCLQAAAREQDVAKLRDMFAPGFTHTHTHTHTHIHTTGRNPIRSISESRMARVNGQWVLAASQATRMPEAA